jgi:hypothetical protein
VTLHFFETQERKETGREGEGSVYSVQQTGVIEVKPAVKIQSVSTTPKFSTTPRSVVQDPTDSGGVTVDVSMLPGDEEVNEGEDEESGHATGVPGPVTAALPTAAVVLNESPTAQYDLMSDLLHTNIQDVLGYVAE